MALHSVHQQVTSWLTNHRSEYVDVLKELVQTDTRVIGHGIDGGLEQAGQNIILKRLARLSCSVDVFAPDNERLELYPAGNKGHNYENRENIVATFKGSGEGRSLILNGHIDTMPYGNRTTWQHDPFSAHVEDEVLYGLGSADMKSGTIGLLLAVETLHGLGVRLQGDVIFQSVVDEEGGGNGTLACVDRGYRADGAVVAEPTNFEIQPMHMGFLFYKVEVVGKSIHSSRKWRGENAIEKAIHLIAALHQLEHRWMMEKRHPLLPPPTINVGEIHGGSAGSTVPGDCFFTLCLHYLPEDADTEGLGSKVEAEIMDVIHRACQADTWLAGNPPKITRYQEGSPFETPLSHPLIESARKCMSDTNRKPVIAGMPAGCDARFFPIYADTPCIIVGPAHAEQAHAINEHVHVDDFIQYIEFVCHLLLEWCGQEEIV